MKRALPKRAADDFVRPAIAIVATAFFVRCLHLWLISGSPFFDVLLGDSKVYDAWARTIAEGDWIGREVFYQAPLYPYFVGVIYTVFGIDPLAVRIAQAALGSAACLLLALTGRRLFGDRIGLIAGLMLALYAPAIFFDGLLQKAALDLFLMCLALWLLVSERWLLLGVAMGALSLTRENALLLVGVIVVFVASGVRLALTPPRAESRGGFSRTSAASRGPVKAATFLLGVALVLLPVAIRNYAVGGGFYLTTSQFGPNFYLGNNPFTDGTASSMRGGRGSAEYERQDAVELAQAATGRTLTPAEVSEYWTGRALDYIRAQPGDWVRLMARKFALLWNRTEMLDTESQESYAEWSWPLKIGALFGNFGVIVPLALLGVLVTWPLRSRLWAIYALAIVYAASVLMFFIYARYRYPLVPFLLLFAAAGVGGAADFFRAASRKRALLTAAAVIAVAFLTNWPALSADHMRAITDHNVGAELQTQGRLDAAIDHYRRALAAKPDYAPAYNNLGTALLAKGRAQEAVEAYERALELEPEYANAHYNLGNALLQAGHADRAVPHFRRSLELGPGSADAHNNLGIALAESGRSAEAIAQFREALRYEPDSAKVRRNLGRLLMTPQSMEEAIVELSRVVALTPDDPEAHNDLGVALANVGRLADAAQSFERAVKVAPNFSEAQRNLAAVRAELSKTR